MNKMLDKFPILYMMAFCPLQNTLIYHNNIFNMNTMFKKFMAVMAIVGIFSTSTVFALDGDPAPQGPGLISSGDIVDVSELTIDPSNGQTATVSFDLSENAKFWADMVNEANGQAYPLIGSVNNQTAIDVQPNDNTVRFTVYGTTDNTRNGVVLADADYRIRVFATNGAVADQAFGDITVSSVVVDADAPFVSHLTASPAKFDARDGESTTIDFDISEAAFVTVVVEDHGVVVREFNDYKGRQSTFRDIDDNLALSWNGRNNAGTIVADGDYRVRVTAENGDGSNQSVIEVQVDTQDGRSNGVIEDVELTPSNNWDPEREELEIDVELSQNVRRLLVRLEKGNEIIEIADDDYVDDRDYVVTFDGVDDDGDAIREGVWNLVIWADADKVEMPVTVRYQEQEILETFVTKESIDSSEDEFLDVLVKTGATSNITVEIYRGNQKEVTLVKDEPISKNRYYAFRWDGKDREGDDAIAGGSWRVKVTAENRTDDDVYATEFIEIDVDQDRVSDRKSNVTNDSVTPAVFDDERDSFVEISFCIDEDETDVTLEVFENRSTSGNAEADVLDGVELNAGCHTYEWNGLDDDNKRLSDGMYTYKLVSKSSKNRTETEIGRFAIGKSGNVGGYNVSVPPVVPPVVDPMPPIVVPPVYSNCGGYWDTAQLAVSDAETCEAIEFVTNAGIFNGYQDGSFGPYNYINRAETLKSVFLATGAPVYPVDGSNSGFTDVQAHAWYMPYVRTAVLENFLQGYVDSRGERVARLDNNITRAEFLKLALEAARKFNGTYIAPAGNYSPYADVSASNPAQAWMLDYVNVAYQNYLFDEHYNEMTGLYSIGANDLVQRREVALLIYRMANANLL